MQERLELISLATGETHHSLYRRLNYCLTDWTDNEVNEICDEFIHRLPLLKDDA